MNRRDVLATMGISLSTPLVGCLQTSNTGSENEEQEYEECYLIEIQYEWFPQDIKDEVDTALEEGSYETDTLLFAEAVDAEESYLVVNDTPYEPIVETSNETQTLELHEVDVIRTPEPRNIRVHNDDDRKHEVHVELTNGETFVAETITLDSGEETELEATDRFGTYNLSARTLTGHGAEEYDYRYSISDSTRDAYVTITEDEVRVSHTESDLEPCSWDVTGSRFPN
ncbi:hypothetical protein [Natrarchaeobaculum sulfurireducens]|uniref:Uncharacterized protein n=2 Tax=Natrarchaeobaculum sulfurireducens TaxID=2044521 RepID=A0A346PL49_9EURY|nr:hypothetical protein [Natrarchaeobaculum sulfurireducens]AXR80244.1 hypothetical protein AArcMg_0221 [Natrarchaeobaculum sulfurireducens]